VIIEHCGCLAHVQVLLNHLKLVSKFRKDFDKYNIKARAWACSLGFQNLKPGTSPFQALVRVGLWPGLNGLGSAGSGLEAQPSTSLVWTYLTILQYHVLPNLVFISLT
jgi:hypothetical protein